MTYPRTFSHIGITVTNLEEAVNFYTKVLGWYLIMEPTEISKRPKHCISHLAADPAIPSSTS